MSDDEEEEDGVEEQHERMSNFQNNSFRGTSPDIYRGKFNAFPRTKTSN